MKRGISAAGIRRIAQEISEDEWFDNEEAIDDAFWIHAKDGVEYTFSEVAYNIEYFFKDYINNQIREQLGKGLGAAFSDFVNGVDMTPDQKTAILEEANTQANNIVEEMLKEIEYTDIFDTLQNTMSVYDIKSRLTEILIGKHSYL
jgi:hypothetical protein